MHTVSSPLQLALVEESIAYIAYLESILSASNSQVSIIIPSNKDKEKLKMHFFLEELISCMPAIFRTLPPSSIPQC